MKIYTYSQAREKLADIQLTLKRVLIKSRPPKVLQIFTETHNI